MCVSLKSLIILTLKPDADTPDLVYYKVRPNDYATF